MLDSAPPPLIAIVLAGGRASREFTAATGVANRARAELTPGRSMLDYILAALTASSVTRIFVVGDVQGDSSLRKYEQCTVLTPGDSLVDNIVIGFEAAGVPSDGYALLVSADIPFIDAAAVDDFVASARDSGADFCYPIVPMAEYRKRFAALRRTTLKLAEGEYTGGNVTLARASMVTRNPDAIRRAYAARKSVPALGGLLGWPLLLRIVASQVAAPRLLTIPLLERAVSRALAGASVAAIVTPHASLGTDVDRAEDVRFARELLSRPPAPG